CHESIAGVVYNGPVGASAPCGGPEVGMSIHIRRPRFHLQDQEISVSKKFIALTAAAVTGSIAFAGAASARDQVHIAGSSTVLPYANIVAEQFGKTFNKFKTPIVESGGSSA